MAMFCELQLVHETGYFLPQPTLEDRWQQVTRTTYMYLSRSTVRFEYNVTGDHLCICVIFDVMPASLLFAHLVSAYKSTRRWHVTISCQPDGRPPQPVRHWKSGRVHLADGSNVIVLQLPYSTEFGRDSRKFASGVRKYGKFDDGG